MQSQIFHTNTRLGCSDDYKLIGCSSNWYIPLCIEYVFNAVAMYDVFWAFETYVRTSFGLCLKKLIWHFFHIVNILIQVFF